MRNSYRWLLVASLTLVVMSGCHRMDGIPTGAAGTPGSPDSYPMLTSSQLPVGRVDVWEDWGTSPATLHVKYVVTEQNWYLTECRLAAALELDSIPQSNGNPTSRKFEWQSGPLNQVTEYEFAIPFKTGWDTDRVLRAAAYCELVPVVNNKPGHGTSGWCGTEAFAGRKWALYLLYRVDGETPGGSEFRTVTQGHWGASPAADYWAEYLALHFEEAFNPDLKVGYGKYLLLSNAPAAEVYLADHGVPTKLAKSIRDPDYSVSVFAGQVVALFVNVQFDATFPDFAPSETNLKNLYVADPASPFHGWTVAEVLAEANKVLGGYGSYPPADMNVCVTKINENHADLGDNHFLSVSQP